jgi:dTDP-glucose 4,6-dehydratase
MTRPAIRAAVITGGAGFIGTHLARRLLDLGAEVTCVDNFCTGSRRNLAALHRRAGFRLIEADVTEGLPVTGPADVVLHLASPASPLDYARLPVETLRAGALGTLSALEFARSAGARFVLASTSEVYGDPLQHPQREDYWGNVNPVGPRSVYDEAKRYAEALTTAYREHRQVDAGIVRIFNTYGPGMRAADGRAIPTFITQALAGQPLTVAGDGSQTRSVCYVDDTVAALLAMARAAVPGPVNIGNPQEMTVLRLAEMIRDLTDPAVPVRFIDRPVDDPAVRRPDITLAARQLGWRPAVAPAEGLRRTIEWFAGQPRRAAERPPVPAGS